MAGYGHGPQLTIGQGNTWGRFPVNALIDLPIRSRSVVYSAVMDYWWAVLAASVGLLAGLQGVVERYPKDIRGAACSRPGLVYLLSRAILPTVFFFLIHPVAELHPALVAISVGIGIEAFLRSRVYVKRRINDDGTTQEIHIGPAELLRFYQDFWLTRAGFVVAFRRRDFVLSNLPANLTAADIALRVRDRLRIVNLPDDQRTRVIDETHKAEEDWNDLLARNPDPPDVVIARHRERFGYALRAIVSDARFETLLAETNITLHPRAVEMAARLERDEQRLVYDAIANYGTTGKWVRKERLSVPDLYVVRLSKRIRLIVEHKQSATLVIDVLTAEKFARVRQSFGQRR